MSVQGCLRIIPIPFALYTRATVRLYERRKEAQKSKELKSPVASTQQVHSVSV